MLNRQALFIISSLPAKDLLRSADENVKRAAHVLLVRGRVGAHHADGVDPGDDGRGEEDLSPGVDELVDFLGQSVGCLVDLGHGRLLRFVRTHAVGVGGSVDDGLRIPHAQHRQGKCRLGDNLKEIGPLADQAREDAANLDGPADVRLHPLQTVAAHDEPDLESAEAATQRDLPVPVVGDDALVGVRIAQVSRDDVQGVCQVEAVAHEETAVEVSKEYAKKEKWDTPTCSRN